MARISILKTWRMFFNKRATEIEHSLGNKNLVILDARSAEEYNGSNIRIVRRGHVPSAVNIDWETKGGLRINILYMLHRDT